MSVQPPLVGPAFVLPERLDRLAERWARLPWRLRTAIGLMGLCALLLIHINAITNAKGAAANLNRVWVATETLVPGSASQGKFKLAYVPDAALPELAVSEAPTALPVLTIVAGTIATSAHFEGTNPAPAVPLGHRALAISTPDADLFGPGDRVDLWDLTQDPVSVLANGLVVIQVKSSRVVVGIPEQQSAQIMQLHASGKIQLAPAGSPTQTRTGESSPSPTAGPSAIAAPSASPTGPTEDEGRITKPP